VGLMVFPYFVQSLLLTYLIGAGLTICLFVFKE
jgi:hypothetical protein